jgi:hypothetical protein
MSDELMYGWERCTHEGIGQPGCRTCDPDKVRVSNRYEWLLKRETAVLNATITDLARRHAWAMALYSAFKKIGREVDARIEHDHALTSKDGLRARVAEVIKELSAKELDRPIYVDRQVSPPCPGCNGTGDIGADEEVHCHHCGGDGKLDVERIAHLKKLGAQI